MVSHNEHLKRVKEHLGTFNPGQYGTWRGKSYPYILKIDESNKHNSQLQTIIKYGLIENVKNLPFFYKNNSPLAKIKLHTYAHHLNSSQMMCYNFFRPLITDDHKPMQQLIAIFDRLGLNVKDSDETIAQFEYEEKNEKTNFDFYLKVGNTQIFCEIKYTEADFGKECHASDNKHYENKYKGMIEDCSHLWKQEVEKEDFMHQYFQLFRNSLRAKTENDYVLFICPKGRTDLEDSFTTFRDKYVKDECKNIMYVTWEQLVDHAKELSVDVEEFANRYLNI